MLLYLKMASEADSSSFLASVSFSGASTQQSSRVNRTRGRSAHTLWAHSRPARLEDGEVLKDRYCLYCEAPNQIYHSTVATNFRRHLEADHTIVITTEASPVQAEVISQLQQLYLKAEESGQTKEIDTQVFRKYLNPDAIKEALVSLIVVRSLAFRLVEWPEFHVLCQLLNPEAKEVMTTAHSTVSKILDRSWITHKDVVRRKLQSAISSIHLSLDI